jgi:hypothetical protein
MMRPPAPVAIAATLNAAAGSSRWNAALTALGASEADDPGAELPPGDAEFVGLPDGEADGPTDGEATAGAGLLGEGVGRSPTGSGPTKTNAARTAAATMTPVSSPARIAAALFIAARGYQYGRPAAP